MERINVLVTAELDKNLLNTLSEIFNFHYAGYGENYTMLSHEELKELCKKADILISEFDMIDEDILSVSNMKLIVCCRSGVSTVIDLDAARMHGIIVCNNVGRNKNATVDFTIALIYDLLRNITLSDRMVHSTHLSEICRPMPKEYGDALWGLDKESPYILYRGPSISETVVGVVGYGQIGELLCEKLDKLEIKYVITTLHPPKGDSRFVSMDELLEQSDIVTIHVSGNKNKTPIIRESELKKMKKTAYLINTSRGYLVDEDALYSSLKNKEIAGAATDVLVREPIARDSKLLELDNLIITPHIAGSSRDTIIYGTNMVINALLGFVQGNVPNRVV